MTTHRTGDYPAGADRRRDDHFGPLPLHQRAQHPAGGPGPGKLRVSHVAVWRWVHKFSRRADPKALWLPRLPQTLIVDDTSLQLASRRIWLFLATDPGRRGIVYAKLYVGRSQWVVEGFLQAIRRLYGGWPWGWVADRGPWYRTVSVVLTGTGDPKDSQLSGEPLANFAGCFPGGSMKERIWTWAGFYNSSKFHLS